MTTFKLRTAESEDFDKVCPLVILAIEDLANQFAGTYDEETLLHRMKAIYEVEGTRFYKGYGLVVEACHENGSTEVCAVGYAYPGKDMKGMTETMLRVYEQVGATYSEETFDYLVSSKEAEADEFYIDNLAVYEPFRGYGLSRRLIEAFEEKGKTLGYRKISILADQHNPKAKAIYEKMGYEPDALYEVLGHMYHHMVKGV